MIAFIEIIILISILVDSTRRSFISLMFAHQFLKAFLEDIEDDDNKLISVSAACLTIWSIK